MLKVCSVSAQGALLVPQESQVPEELRSSPKVAACLLQIKNTAKQVGPVTIVDSEDVAMSDASKQEGPIYKDAFKSKADLCDAFDCIAEVAGTVVSLLICSPQGCPNQPTNQLADQPTNRPAN